MPSAADLQAQRRGGGNGGGRVNNVVRLPAPSGGWNARDAYEAMEPNHAIRLTNWIPGLLGVRLRKGNAQFATGMVSTVETLMEYAPPDGSGRKQFAAAGASIFDVSAAGAVGTALLTGMTSAVYQSTMFTNSAGSYLFIVNGIDAPRHFNGSVWATPAITVATPANFIAVASHKNRLWFTEKATLDAWYLPTSVIAGAATKFPLGPLCKLGGSLTAIGTWSRDGGDGADDLFVAVTSEGEVIVYQGTDPASASTWSLVGVFRIARPITRRCFVKAGADLGVLTVDGPVSLGQVLPAAGSVQRRASLTDMISNAFRLAYSIAPSDSAWSILEAPSDGLILINVPGSAAGVTSQYIMSADTGGWADWVDINATCIGLFNDEIYFGKAGGVVSKYGDTFSDDEAPITATLQTAFVALKGIEEKRYTMARPIMQGPAGYIPSFVVRTNYDISPADVSTVTVVTGDGAEWDVAEWDVASWYSNAVPITKWQSVSGIGSVASLAFSVATDIEMTLQGVDLMFDAGGPQ
jgi:hypothetical protein